MPSNKVGYIGYILHPDTVGCMRGTLLLLFAAVTQPRVGDGGCRCKAVYVLLQGWTEVFRKHSEHTPLSNNKWQIFICDGNRMSKFMLFLHLALDVRKGN